MSSITIYNLDPGVKERPAVARANGAGVVTRDMGGFEDCVFRLSIRGTRHHKVATA